MSYNVNILADSITPQGDRLTTMKITFPRFILAEMNTHRMFSRNSASSRAIPFNKMIKMVQENPFIPIAWQKDHKGMQGTEYITDKDDIKRCIHYWIKSKNQAIENAEHLNGIGVTKQLCNRLLEPFMWHTVIVTASEWENFFNLRCPQYQIPVDNNNISYRSKRDLNKSTEGWWNKHQKPMTEVDWLKINKSQADIHIQAIAELMWDAYNKSKPKQLQAGEWHIPFGDNLVNHVEEDGMHTDSKIDLAGNWIGLFPDIDNLEDIPYDYQYDNWLQMQKVKIATARCARISYETLGDNPKTDYEADIKLHDRLLAEGHMSPFEHCARVMTSEEYSRFFNGDSEGKFTNEKQFIESFGWCRNFKGFIQYRHLVKNN